MKYSESNIMLEPFRDAYRNTPAAHDNPDAIQVLVEAQNRVEAAIGDMEDKVDAAESRGYDQGYDEGREAAYGEISEYVDQIEELIEKIGKATR